MSERIQQALQEQISLSKKVLNLSFADFTFFPSLLQENKIKKSLSLISKYPYYYPTPKGDVDARQAIVNYYGKYGQELDLENVILTSNNNQSLLFLFKILGNSGEILTATPHGPDALEVADFLEMKLKTFQLNPQDNWQIDFKSLQKAITPKTKAILLQSPHLPTGAIQTAETLTKLLDHIKGKNIVLIVDESLSDFVFEKNQYPIVQNLLTPDASKSSVKNKSITEEIFNPNPETPISKDHPTIITLQNLTNSFALPGLKLSWLIFHGHPDNLAPLTKAFEYLSDTFLTVNQPAQTILPEIIKYSQNWRYKFQKRVEKNRNLAISKLSKIKTAQFVHPAGGFSCLITLPEEQRSDEDFVIDLLRETGVYVHPGRYYGQTGQCTFMISFLQSSKSLRKGLKLLRRFLKPKKS